MFKRKDAQIFRQSIMGKYVVFLLAALGLCSCNKEAPDTKLLFIGDSMVANWDVKRYFPNRIVENRGIDGIGIDDISKIKMPDSLTDVILLIGTNDIKPTMSEEQITTYAIHYTNTIDDIAGKRLILIPILPTSSKEKNHNIETINSLIRIIIAQRSRVIYIDCYDQFTKDGSIKENLSRDGTHLNDYGYMLLTDIVRGRL